MMLRIVSPPSGVPLAGNIPITATMLNPAMATKVNFKANGVTFATVDPALTMNADLNTLSRGLGGSVNITVQTTGNVYTATRTITVSNPTSIYVKDCSGNSGSYVTVHVMLNNYASAAGYHVILNYPSAKLQLDASSVHKGSGISAAAGFVSDTGTPGVLDVTVTGNTAFTNGDLLTANFLIKNFSASGTTNNITISAPPALTSTTGSSITAVPVTGCVTTN